MPSLSALLFLAQRTLPTLPTPLTLRRTRYATFAVAAAAKVASAGVFALVSLHWAAHKPLHLVMVCCILRLNAPSHLW